MLDGTYVHERLRELWPTSAQLTTAIADEIAEGFTRMKLGPMAFDAALKNYRVKNDWVPTLKKLRSHIAQEPNYYIPLARATPEQIAATKKMARDWLDNHRKESRDEKSKDE